MAITFVNTVFPIGHYWSVTREGNVVTTDRVSHGPVTANGTIAAAGDTFTMTNANGTFTLTVTIYDSADAFLATASGLELLFSNTVLVRGQQLALTSDGFGDYQLPCFAAGTRIATRRGEVAVEALAVGDEVALLDGGFAPVVWLGRREVDCNALRHPAEGWPLRVRAHAFGPGAPCRDLFLSPDHAVFAEGVLIPVRYLENGTTIRREARDAVTYWHVELARHDVVRAEGLPCESYLDTGNRDAFGPRGRGTDDAAAAWEAWATQACAKLEVGGAAVARVRAGLAARAAALGLAAPDGPGPRLRAGGRDHAARRDGEFWHVRLPAPCGEARLVSDSFVPAALDPAQEDWRCLGMAVRELVADGHSLPLTHPALRGGWHDPEPALRWTSGAATLPRLRELAVRVAPLGPWPTGPWAEQA